MTPHNILLYLQSLSRGSPLYCKKVKAEVRVFPATCNETDVVMKLTELGIDVEEVCRAGFYQNHKIMGLVNDVGAYEEYEGFTLSFEKGGEIDNFKETRVVEGGSGNRIILNPLGMVCAEHFQNTYRYLLDSKEYIDPRSRTGGSSPEHKINPESRSLTTAPDFSISLRAPFGRSPQYKRNPTSWPSATPPDFSISLRAPFGRSPQYKRNPTSWPSATPPDFSITGISKELNSYIIEIIEKHAAAYSLGECGFRVIGQYRGTELKIKRNENGEWGYYLEWGKEPHLQRKSLETHLLEGLDERCAIEIIERGMRELENSADYKRVFRILDPYTSIRHGKFGTYIYHRTEEMSKTKFLSLKKCPFNYMTVPVEEIMEWVYDNIPTSDRRELVGI